MKAVRPDGAQLAWIAKALHRLATPRRRAGGAANYRLRSRNPKGETWPKNGLQQGFRRDTSSRAHGRQLATYPRT